VITHLCRSCATPVDVERVDVTRILDMVPRFLWGRWERCTGCGGTEAPMELVDANDKALGLGQWEPK
jgi:hypothetical protein